MREFLRLEYVERLKSTKVEEESWLTSITAGMDKDKRREEIKRLKLLFKKMRREWEQMTAEDLRSLKVDASRYQTSFFSYLLFI